MESSPKVTFIIPAYNAEKYLPEAVESILAQTCDAWKIIIVDDCSTDHTLQIAEDFATRDERITLMRMKSQSGGAFLPRKAAIIAADTPLISPLDADDTITPEYLQRLLDTMEKENADVVYPMMYSLRKGEYKFTHTPDTSLIGKTLTGEEAMTATLDGWRIHCNGGIIRKEHYLKTFGMVEERNVKVKSYLDEYFTRILLFNCHRVAITDERYIFRENPDSITHSKDIRAFGFLYNNFRLLSFVENYFRCDSEAYFRVNRQNFHGIADALRILNVALLSPKDREWVMHMLESCRRSIDYKVLKGKISVKYKALLSLPFTISIPLMRIIDSLHSVDGNEAK